MEVIQIQTDYNRIKRALRETKNLGIKEGHKEATQLMLEVTLHRGLSFSQKVELVGIFRGLPEPY